MEKLKVIFWIYAFLKKQNFYKQRQAEIGKKIKPKLK